MGMQQNQHENNPTTEIQPQIKAPVKLSKIELKLRKKLKLIQMQMGNEERKEKRK